MTCLMRHDIDVSILYSCGCQMLAFIRNPWRLCYNQINGTPFPEFPNLIVCLEWGPRICILIKFSDTDAVVSGTTLLETLLYRIILLHAFFESLSKNIQLIIFFISYGFLKKTIVLHNDYMWLLWLAVLGLYIICYF